MAKQVIRLTEGDLHKIIEESVEKILTELDWRTYDQAADKAFDAYTKAPSHEEKRVKQYQRDKFKNAAIARQNKQYDGVNNYNYDQGLTTYPKKIDGKPTSQRKQMAGAAQIARYKRGGDEFNNDKKRWQPKI
jgi:hypothetical protein